VDALKALSTFFGENEKRSLEISEKFESQFKEVKQVCLSKKCFLLLTFFIQYKNVSDSFLIKK